MIANYHTHSTFCDGKNTAEEIVLAAIEKGFSAIGFSGHGYTAFDLRYCMKDTESYVSEINNLKHKYKDKIQIYLGVEEDAFSYTERKNFDYIIGSSHYFCRDGKYYPIDSNYDYFQKCLQLFEHDVVKMAHTYYSSFCNYITKRRPEIIGHFDLITKFDEEDTSYILDNREYNDVAEKYIASIADKGCIFEVNTGAISRGYRTSPYPAENLLHILKRSDAKLILSSDSHSITTLDFGFDDIRHYLKDMGFQYVYVLHNDNFVKDFL